jgi:hypothetical protein
MPKRPLRLERNIMVKAALCCKDCQGDFSEIFCYCMENTKQNQQIYGQQGQEVIKKQIKESQFQTNQNFVF